MVVDCSDRLDLSGGFEELTKAVASLREIDAEGLLRILHSRGEAFLFLKVGYILQKNFRYRLDTSFYDECSSHHSKKKYYFGAKPGFGVYIKEWNLVVPAKEDTPDGLL
jgi:predicted transcriptional regulator of viral defense system